MEREGKTFIYLNVKLLLTYPLCNLRLMKYSEVFTLGSITFGVALKFGLNHSLDNKVMDLYLTVCQRD